ncbi:MAG TPA: ABC transporter substrate-binding protein [Burkholderiales bacterium]|nr:ABC transporter substrate-binding protein [Burkholderiales bacterium]
MKLNRDSPYFSSRRALLVAASLAPLAAYAQFFSERVRRVAVLMGYSPGDPAAQTRYGALKAGLSAKGWEEGKNLKLDAYWTEGDAQRASDLASQAVARQPEVIVTNTTPVTAAVHRETRTIPVVFTVVSDPVGSGFVSSLARPGGNVTGLVNLESSLAQKWIELLAQVAPKMRRVAVMYNPKTAPYAEYYMKGLNAAAAQLGITSFIAAVTSPRDIEEAVLEVSRDRATGIIAMTDSFMFVHRKTLVAATARRKVPAIYYGAEIALEGGLMSYGVDSTELFRRAASYVDLILRGAKPAELPVEQPSKFELYVNARTAKALGLAIPQGILLRADKVIE